MSQNGVILERLSGKKLSILVAMLLILQVAFFLIGGFSFPNSTHSESVEATICRDRDNNENKFYYTRDRYGKPNGNCERIQNEIEEPYGLSQKDIVYAFQIPLPRDGQVLTFSRFFQTMTCVLHLEINFNKENQIESFVNFNDNNSKENKLRQKISMLIRLGYRNQADSDNKWSLLAQSKTEKKFQCELSKYSNSLECDLVQLFELGSVHHEFYLINIKLYESRLIKDDIHYSAVELPNVRLISTFIYQTGGFTKMWFAMKTFFFPFLLLIMIWYWQRIVKLERSSNILERSLFVVGLAATLLNLPVEWFSLYFDLKWMLFYSDIRQGIFYLALFTFWIIFCGEHHIEESLGSCKSFKSYWKYIGIVWLCSLCLLIFDLCERGIQLTYPFFSIWDSEVGSKIAMVSLILASASGISYFILILYLVIQIFLTFKSKRSQLPHMSKMRRLFYEGIIYRFKFLLISTLMCVAITIGFSIFSNYNQTHWKFDTEDIVFNYSSAFLAGVYAMWNIYVSALMIFYAPSHKNKNQQTEDELNGETIEFTSLTTTYSTNSNATESVVASFARKVAIG